MGYMGKRFRVTITYPNGLSISAKVWAYSDESAVRSILDLVKEVYLDTTAHLLAKTEIIEDPVEPVKVEVVDEQ